LCNNKTTLKKNNKSKNKLGFIHTAIFENVAPTAEKNIRECLCMIICGEASPHQVEEINRTADEINGRIAS
jgi:hypothetical protein